MLLVFEWTGSDTSTSAYTFILQDNLIFDKLTLKNVQLMCRSNKLQEDWSTPSRKMKAPLYLDMDFTGAHDIAHMMPATFTDSSGRANTVSNNLVAIGTATDDGADDSIFGLPQRDINLQVINHRTEWPKNKELTLSIQHRSVETEGTFGDIAAMDSTHWDDGCRVVVTFEAEGGFQSEQTVA